MSPSGYGQARRRGSPGFRVIQRPARRDGGRRRRVDRPPGSRLHRPRAAAASLNVALPGIARATGATQTQLQWMVDAYSLAFAALLLPAGAIGDRFGRKPILIAGLGLFGLSSLLALFAHSAEQLIALRV